MGMPFYVAPEQVMKDRADDDAPADEATEPEG